MIDELLNFMLGLVDGTSDNDSDAENQLKVMERERLKIDLKRLRRR